MKTKAWFIPALIIIAAMLEATGCRPDRQGPNDQYCTSGVSWATVNDDNVPADVKSKIYNINGGNINGNIINVNNPEYNKQGKVVIIPFATTDYPANTALTKKVIEDEFFSPNSGSISDFYYENSWGQFQLTNAGISNVVKLNKAFTDYKYRESDWHLMRDVCQQSSIDWESLDINHDYKIDHSEVQVVFIQSDGGSGATRSPNNVFEKDYTNLHNYVSVIYRDHEYQIYNYFINVGCKKDSDISKAVKTISYNTSTICHELGHGFFNLPDRYAKGTCGLGSSGQYDLMSDNCVQMHLSIYEKMLIGWIKPKIIYFSYDENTSHVIGHCTSIAAIEQAPAALIRYNTDSPDEFWIIANRNKKSAKFNFESGLPDEGLAVWWVKISTGEVHLINASKKATTPQSYQNQGANSLFKYDQNNSKKIYVFNNSNGKLAFIMKGISPPGGTMYFSF